MGLISINVVQSSGGVTKYLKCVMLGFSVFSASPLRIYQDYIHKVPVILHDDS